MKKINFNKISGLTLVEVLISIAVSSIMMAALFTTYNLISRSYNQVIDRATISQSSRDFMGMLVKDIRMAGYKYFGDNIPGHQDHIPIAILKSQRFGNANGCCDELFIVYGDYNINEPNVNNRYERYVAHYFVQPSEIIDPRTEEPIETGALYKSLEKWNGATFSAAGCEPGQCYLEQLLTNYVEDFVVVPVDDIGNIINPAPDWNNAERAFDIKAIDILITLRSKEEFYKTRKERVISAIGNNSAGRQIQKNDKYFRDSVLVTINTRNIGIDQ